MTQNYGLQKRPLRLFSAIKTTRRLINDKEDTSLVFKLIRDLGNPHMKGHIDEFIAHPDGQRILGFERDLSETLKDSDYLRSLPKDSLGRTYLNFIQTENITADGLIEASNEDDHSKRAQQGWDQRAITYSNRVRDSHDLWHVVTGFGRDPLGELALLAFSYAQVKTRGFALIILMAARKVKREYPKNLPFYKAIYEGYLGGKSADWLPLTVWEDLLDTPLDKVRERLNICPSPAYKDVKTSLNSCCEGSREDPQDALDPAF